MTRPSVLVMGCVIVAATLSSCGEEDRNFRGPVVPVSDVDLGPVSTFSTDCSRCHGERGAYYAQPFQYQADALRAKVEQMMRDHAPQEPTETDIRAMLAYHMAIREDKPFVIVTNGAALVNGTQRTLRGEADADAKVTVEADGQTYEPQRDGATWSLADAPGPPLTITATRDERTHTIELRR